MGEVQNLSAIIGVLCLIISYLVVRPLTVSLDELRETLREVKVTLEQISVDNTNLKNDYIALNEKSKAAFRIIDGLKEEIKVLKEEVDKLKHQN